MMQSWIIGFLGVWLLASVVSGQQLTVESLTGGDVSPCADKCAATAEMMKTASNEVKSCQTGCRLLSIIETVDFDPSTGDYDGTLRNCAKSCDASFKDGKEKSSCNLGCSYQVPLSKERRNKMLSSPDSIFGESLPRINFGFPANYDDDNAVGLSDLFSSSSVDGIFASMQKQMNDMVNRVMSQVGVAEDGIAMAAPKGRLVVVKSGPGYHEEKTYEFGPDGVKAETKSEGGRDVDEVQFVNDMMAKSNPLEQLLNNGDVEIFEPRVVVVPPVASVAKNQATAKEDDPAFSHIHVLKPYVHDLPVNRFDFGNELDGLPEQGMRNRDADLLWREQICAQASHNMKWSDWVSCHMCVGFPRWLTAATLSLAIIFIIWLCLVIPRRDAPKQAKAKESASKLEKEHLANLRARPELHKADPLSPPPLYDDVASLHVVVPVEEGLLEKESVAAIPKV